MEWWKFLILIVGSYLMGNIFFARIISRLRHYDISKAGSGNPGTMNMVRNLGFSMGLLTLLLDMLKGVIPSICGYLLFGGNFYDLITCNGASSQSSYGCYNFHWRISVSLVV